MKEGYKEFYERIELFVHSQLDQYIPENLGDKIIHDTIWGSVVYRGWEIQLIDSPLFQRLRDIQQLGRAEMTYPAARHTRFEHSLGTVAIASRMIDKLSERSNCFQITNSHKNLVRLAALLHDVGHCFYSHLSENVYGNMPQFLEIRKEIEKNLDKHLHPKPHELFTYMIIKSDAMLDFFYKYINYPGKTTKAHCAEILTCCANMVVGQRNLVTENGKTTALTFLTDILNSDFDADKLDYTQRDSYTSGIALTYGIERFLMKIKLCCIKNVEILEYRMAITSDAVTTVEELIFNRNMLYVYMYRHQKVLAVEAAVRDIIQGMLQGNFITHPCDFLTFTDQDINNLSGEQTIPFPQAAPKRRLGELVKTVKNRNLPKRLFELKSENIVCKDKEKTRKKALRDCVNQIMTTEEDETKILQDFIFLYNKSYTDNSLLREEIIKFTDILGFQDFTRIFTLRLQLYNQICQEYKRLGKTVNFDVFDIHIVFPNITKSKAEFLVVQKGSDIPELYKFIYLKEWSDTFNLTNWRGYIFADVKIDRNIAKPIAENFVKNFNKNVIL